MDSSNLTVIYHAPCADGSTAAAIIYANLLTAAERGAMEALDADPRCAMGFPRLAECIANRLPVFCGIHPRNFPPTIAVRDRDVIFVDVSMDAAHYAACASARSLGVLDHHDTSAYLLEHQKHPDKAPEWFSRITHLCVCMDKCGAELAWEYACGKLPAPVLLDYVAANDLWQWERRANARAVYIALTTRGVLSTCASITDALTWPEARFDELAREGEHLMRLRNQRVAELCGRAELATLRIGKAPKDGWGTEQEELVVLAVAASADFSEVGHALCNTPIRSMGGALPDCAAVLSFSLGSVSVSLRAGARSTLKLGRIARGLRGTTGGGGHDAAAGFSFRGTDIKAFLEPRH